MLAPLGRPLPYFCCVRVRCQIDGDELLLDEETYDELLMRHHEPVVVLRREQRSKLKGMQVQTARIYVIAVRTCIPFTLAWVCY